MPTHDRSDQPPSPALWQAHHAALRDLLEAYAGMPTDDAPGAPSAALGEYLGAMLLVDPTGPAVAAAQLRRLAGGGASAAASAPMLPWPPMADRFAWMETVADLIESSVASGNAAPVDVPGTGWAWRRRFPQLFQLLGGYFGQDFPAEHPGVDSAEAERRVVAAWRSGTSRSVVARTVGEVHELLALQLDRGRLEYALGALGRDVELAPDPHLWLRRLSALLVGG
ncbi:contact-dependent growth inhibition system immunity protein [Streptacidiphilus sp. EB129]|uniref:contact-dependent growth inhibition system immunity protein n=1 Tax=Streptacidiphilus sp. EB129 TaxID=3156262 RepID=UPI0035160A20